MAAFSLATGISLLYDEGVLPPNPARQALAFASPAEQSKLESDGLALKRTAAALAMEDEVGDGTIELSPTAMQFLVDDLSSPNPAATNSQAPGISGYPYAGWSSIPDQSTSGAESAVGANASASINLLA
jgi:hypothetical protein